MCLFFLLLSRMKEPAIQENQVKKISRAQGFTKCPEIQRLQYTMQSLWVACDKLLLRLYAANASYDDDNIVDFRWNITECGAAHACALCLQWHQGRKRRTKGKKANTKRKTLE